MDDSDACRDGAAHTFVTSGHLFCIFDSQPMPSYKISDVYNLLKRHQSTLHTSNNYKMFWFLQYFIQKIWMKYFSCPKWQLTQCLIDRVLPCTGQMKDSAGLPHGWTHNFLWQVLKSVDPSTMLPKGVLTAILSCLQLFNS